MKKENVLVPVLGTVAMLLADVASAAVTYDVTDAVADIGATIAPIGLVGLAVFGVYLAVHGYKWIRRALS